ncbi:hypothetical protein EDB84DRAFT_638486 [Lactarius hengduanensis]|nr:hypothetical protein EDB84DRAFT_638486 [Lactarius hengduanensis]
MHPCKLMECRRGSLQPNLTYKRSEHRLPTQTLPTAFTSPPRVDGMVVEVLCPSLETELCEGRTDRYDATRRPPRFGLKKVTRLKDVFEWPFPHAHSGRRIPNPRVSVSVSTSATAPTSASAVPTWPRSSRGSGRRMEISVGAVTPPAAGCDRVLVAATRRALRAE